MNISKLEKKRMEKLWLLFSAMLGSYGIYFAFRSVFIAEFHIQEYVTGMLIFGIFWLPYVFIKGPIWMGYGIGILPIILVFIKNEEEIRIGLVEGIIGNSVRNISQYLQHGELTTKISEEPEKLTGGLLAACGIFLGICMVMGTMRKLRVLLILFYLAVFSFPFFNGVTIQPEGTACIGGAVIAVMMASPVSARTALIVAALASMGIGMILPKQGIERLFSNPQTWQNKIESFFERKAYGGVTDGKLGIVESVEENGEIQLELIFSVKPTQSVYIQGFVGTDYERNQWEESADTGGMSKREIQEEREWEYETVARNKDKLGFQSADVSITRVGANRKYQYLPYKSSQIQPLYGDTYSRAESRTYSVKTILESDIGKMKINPESIADSQSREVKEYTEFVYSRYLQVPEEFRKEWEGTAKGLQGRTLRSTVQNIADYLEDRAVYTKSPGRTPRDKDFVRYFLEENRKGYCVHFASAGVLLLRLNGIPARFVSGYIASPLYFDQEEEGNYKAELDDGAAHAWAEIYVEGCGWMPAEMTPPYADEGEKNSNDMQTENPVTEEKQSEGNGDQNEEQESAENIKIQQQLESGKSQGADSLWTREQAGSGNATEMENGEEQQVINRPMIGAILSVIIVTGILSLMRQRKWRHVKRKKSRKEKYLGTYRILYEMMQFDLKSDIPEEARSLCGLLDQKYGFGEDKALNIIDKVLETAFGNGEPEKEDFRKLQDLARKVRKIIISRKGIFQKFLFTFWKGF